MTSAEERACQDLALVAETRKPSESEAAGEADSTGRCNTFRELVCWVLNRLAKSYFLLVGSGMSGLPGAGLTDELLSGILSRP